MRHLDAHFLDLPARPDLSGPRRVAAEFGYFGIKQVRACLFAGVFFAAVFTVPRGALFGIPRYDLLLLVALAIQGCMVWAIVANLKHIKERVHVPA
jgi:uncharacterized membrane protein YoaT (DUF817 family)